MKVRIELRESSQAIEYKDVKNVYTKGPLLCVYCGECVYKHPLSTVWRVTERYSSARRKR